MSFEFYPLSAADESPQMPLLEAYHLKDDEDAPYFLTTFDDEVTSQERPQISETSPDTSDPQKQDSNKETNGPDFFSRSSGVEEENPRRDAPYPQASGYNRQNNSRPRHKYKTQLGEKSESNCSGSGKYKVSKPQRKKVSFYGVVDSCIVSPNVTPEIHSARRVHAPPGTSNSNKLRRLLSKWLKKDETNLSLLVSAKTPNTKRPGLRNDVREVGSSLRSWVQKHSNVVAQVYPASFFRRNSISTEDNEPRVCDPLADVSNILDRIPEYENDGNRRGLRFMLSNLNKLVSGPDDSEMKEFFRFQDPARQKQPSEFVNGQVSDMQVSDSTAIPPVVSESKAILDKVSSTESEDSGVCSPPDEISEDFQEFKVSWKICETYQNAEESSNANDQAQAQAQAQDDDVEGEIYGCETASLPQHASEYAWLMTVDDHFTPTPESDVEETKSIASEEEPEQQYSEEPICSKVESVTVSIACVRTADPSGFAVVRNPADSIALSRNSKPSGPLQLALERACMSPDSGVDQQLQLSRSNGEEALPQALSLTISNDGSVVPSLVSCDESEDSTSSKIEEIAEEKPRKNLKGLLRSLSCGNLIRSWIPKPREGSIRYRRHALTYRRHLALVDSSRARGGLRPAEIMVYWNYGMTGYESSDDEENQALGSLIHTRTYTQPSQFLWFSLHLNRFEQCRQLRAEFLEGREFSLFLQARQSVQDLQESFIFDNLAFDVAQAGKEHSGSTAASLSNPATDLEIPVPAPRDCTPQSPFQQATNGQLSSPIVRIAPVPITLDRLKLKERQLWQVMLQCQLNVVELKMDGKSRSLDEVIAGFREFFELTRVVFVTTAVSEISGYVSHMFQVRQSISSALEGMQNLSSVYAQFLDSCLKNTESDKTLEEAEEFLTHIYAQLSDCDAVLQVTHADLNEMKETLLEDSDVMFQCIRAATEAQVEIARTLQEFSSLGMAQSLTNEELYRRIGFTQLRAESKLLKKYRGILSKQNFQYALADLESALMMVNDLRVDLMLNFTSVMTSVIERQEKKKKFLKLSEGDSID